MIFEDKLITVGRGKLSGSSIIDSTGYLVLKSEGKLTLKKLDLDTLRVYGARLLGYADECWILPAGKIERLGEDVIYENTIER